jgi:capsular polysaccharide biosynthesis protein
METWLTWPQEDFILDWDLPCTIEPRYGWAFTGFNTLIYESLSFSRTDHQRKPSLMSYWLRKDVLKLDHAISLRDTGEENYFHFFNDVLSKLYWLKQHGVDISSIPVIVSERLWSKSYFQGYVGMSQALQTIQWVVQDLQYIECERVYFVKAPTHHPDLWASIFNTIPNLHSSSAVRVFITRKKLRLRYLKNIDEILKVCQNFGFAIIDTEELSFEEQADLFSRANVIVGIHGAGLTNMFFRKGDCKILEIFPSLNLGYLPFHYIMLAKMRGFKYNAIIGSEESGDTSGGFTLKPSMFEEAIKGIAGDDQLLEKWRM